MCCTEKEINKLTFNYVKLKKLDDIFELLTETYDEDIMSFYNNEGLEKITITSYPSYCGQCVLNWSFNDLTTDEIEIDTLLVENLLNISSRNI